MADTAILRHPEVRRAGLLPQLLHAADRARIELDPQLRSAWRAARVHEDLRLTRLLPAAREELGEHRGQIVLRGLALSHTVYAEPALRHCHDLDLLVPGQALTTVHSSGFPLSRHVSLFPGATVPVRFAEVQHDSVVSKVAAARTLVLNPVDTLLHVCGHAAWLGPPRDPLWCLDAALVVRHHPELDWGRVIKRGVEWDVATQAYGGLRLLAEQLGVPVPADTLSALRPLVPWVRRVRPLIRRLARAPAR